MQDWQGVIDLVGGSILAVMGWFCRELWDSVKALKNDIQNIEIELPTNYVRKDEINQRFDKIETILEKIFDKLDQKADK